MAPEPVVTPHLEATSDVSAVLIPDPLTVDGVQALRAKSAKLKAGVAAKANLDQFKGIGRHEHKPKAKRWDHLISHESAARQPSSIKDAAKYLTKPGIISLGGGLPSSEYFPYDSISMTVPTVGQFSEKETHENGAAIRAGKHDMVEDKSLLDLATVLNYGQGHGAPQLLRWMCEHTEIVHAPKYSDWQCTMTVGNTSAIEMLLRMLGRPNTVMLTEEYSFGTVIEASKALGVECLGVAVDEEGLLPNEMDEVLINWDPAQHNGAPKPYLLYTVPSGQNPTGATQSLERRKALYEVIQKHDLIVFEDEPYYFLQMQPYNGAEQPPPPPPKSHAEFLASLVPSFLSLDTDGRVIRLDSFSKVIAPGTRVGWITAPEQIIERYQRHSDVSTQAPSGFSQIALYRLLDDHWGHSGYLDWLVHIRMEYTRRRNVILGACEKYLPHEVVSWKAPMAGMFHWLAVRSELHPLAKTMSVRELEDKIWLTAIDKGALLIKGSCFRAEPAKKGMDENLFYRMTFAAVGEKDIEEAVKRFGEALREEFGLSQSANDETNGANGASGNGTAAS